MDPVATLALIKSALQEDDSQEALEGIETLLQWHADGGWLPANTSREALLALYRRCVEAL